MTQEFVTLPRELVERALAALDAEDPYRAAIALRAALEQPQNHVPDAGNMVPDGWKLVPVKPTQEMLDAYIHMQGRFSSARSDWAAMLAAAPQPPTTVDSSVVQLQGKQQPVAEVIESHVRAGLDGRFTAVVAGRERLSVGAEIFVHPQPKREPVAGVVIRDGLPCLLQDRHIKSTDHRVYTHPQPKREPLTHQQIDAIAESMPGGLDGFLKGWGWRHFARSIEAAHNIK